MNQRRALLQLRQMVKLQHLKRDHANRNWGAAEGLLQQAQLQESAALQRSEQALDNWRLALTKAQVFDPLQIAEWGKAAVEARGDHDLVREDLYVRQAERDAAKRQALLAEARATSLASVVKASRGQVRREAEKRALDVTEELIASRSVR